MSTALNPAQLAAAAAANGQVVVTRFAPDGSTVWVIYSPGFVPTDGALDIPGFVSAPLALLRADIAVAMQAAGGAVASIPIATQQTLIAQAQVVLGVAATLAQVSDASLVAAALQATEYADTVIAILTGTEAPQAVFRCISPDLELLAAIYYGDASLWQIIGNANGLSDPQPTGTFVLAIPPAPPAAA